jgi:predicted Zn-dependent peptidase
VEDKALRSAKEFVKGRLMLGMEDTMSVAGWFGRQEAMGGEQLAVEQIVEQMEGISADDLLRVANQLFQASRCQLAVVGPHKRKEEATFRALLANGPLTAGA